MGRFAPSPTGPLHLGSLRTALAAWLFARSAGGRFLLRIEDLDPDRSRPEWEAVQLGALIDLGLDWDGPVLRQSERLGVYTEGLARLEAAGRVYPCFCTRAEIRVAASAPHGGDDLPEGAYPGTCAALSPADGRRRVAAGERHSLRFRAGGERVTFRDRLAGVHSSVVDDFVLRRSDGVLAYQLAVALDDDLQGVTQVVRGADLLDSVGRQTMIRHVLHRPDPEWIHVPVVLGPDGRRLAKRHGSAIDSAEAPTVLGQLGRSLGVAMPADRSPRTAAELLAGWDPARIPTEPLVL